jgi:uncharacterized phage protein (TIGR01671 family)
MKEKKFRGKRIDNGEWIEGAYYEHLPPLQCFASENDEKSKHYIVNTAFADWNMPRQVEFVEVASETVGQYTGRKDKNGKEIYAGDIYDIGICTKYIRPGHFIEDTYELLKMIEDNARFEVMGNIYDSPELLDQI